MIASNILQLNSQDSALKGRSNISDLYRTIHNTTDSLDFLLVPSHEKCSKVKAKERQGEMPNRFILFYLTKIVPHLEGNPRLNPFIPNSRTIHTSMIPISKDGASNNHERNLDVTSKLVENMNNEKSSSTCIRPIFVARCF